MAGLFSVLDALLDQPMREALLSLSLDAEIQSALMRCEGPLADIVHCAINYDRGDFDRVHVDGIDNSTIRTCYLDALAWAAEFSSTAANLL